MTTFQDVRPAREVGRRARAAFTFVSTGGQTTLARGYAEPPLRTGRGFPEPEGLHVILTSSAPGIFGGDAFEQTFDVERDAHVRLTSQSALQVHASPGGEDARLSSTYRVARGARLLCTWDPAIPFPGARIDQRIRIELDRDAVLVWSDAVMSGRVAHGERWRFTTLSHELRVERAHALLYLERYLLEPAAGGLDRPWVASDADYFGTVLSVGRPVTPDAAESLHRTLNAIDGVRAAVDVLDLDLRIVRLMAASGPAFHQARATAYASAVSCA